MKEFFDKYSKQIVASIVSVLGGVAMILGVPLAEETVNSLSVSLSELLGSVMVVYGLVMGVLRKYTTSPLKTILTKK